MKSIKNKVVLVGAIMMALITGGVVASAPANALDWSYSRPCTESMNGNTAYGIWYYAGQTSTYRGYVTEYAWQVEMANTKYFNVDIYDGSVLVHQAAGMTSPNGTWYPPSHIHNLANAWYRFGWRFTNGSTTTCTVHA